MLARLAAPLALLAPAVACSDGASSPTDAATTLASDATDASDAADVGPTRAFRMGFQPWPYDLTQAAVDWTWDRISQDGDVYSIHMEEGVPWPEAAAGSAFSTDYQATLAAKKAAIQPGHAVFLSVNALDTSRSGLARYRGDGIAEPLPAPFDTAALDSELVMDAYTAYCERMIDLFEPDWFLVGIEVNILYRQHPELWPAYLRLVRHVRAALAASHPGLPVGASVFANSYVETYSDPAETPTAQRAALAELRPSLDFLGLSVYPFMSQHLCEDLTADYMPTIFALGDGLPVAVTESGYSAQHWSTTVGTTSLDWNGSEAKQDDFLTRLLSAAEAAQAPFVIWFAVRDYDALWEHIGRDPTALVWRDTGLFDEDGNARSAHATWRAMLARPLSARR
ncbi:MAG: hypothetical protein U1F43_26865 [Myxococcota bacterium]